MASFESHAHAYLRAAAGHRAVRTGPFTLRIDPHDAGFFLNYAIPDDGAEPTGDQVRRLVEAFTGRARTPRLEYLPTAAPRVEDALAASGFTVERQLPILTCDPADVPVPQTAAPIEIMLAETDAQLRKVAQAQGEAYGQPVTAEHDVARLRSGLNRGGLVALALDTVTGQGVGGGQVGPPHGGVSELAAIGVRAAYRRRGIASALAAALTRACPNAGITTPFLMPENNDSERIYQRLGYRRVSEILHISLR
ncbi:GNAT family N-acetyltransferase [Streptomyces sp. CT34]|uniref:GNAT family N-acetyltransferase n=1 Tax=Streptomyces sp. CT34 TaxID=1553907 RepID=UPI0006901DB7|nr:GNAT family N-acetyltransferase [Streptomyces sp. CT34]